MSDDEVEKFEITDYDIENDFNINRPRRKITKNERIYGIWAEEESSGDENSGSRRVGFKGSRKPKNYTAPIGFVAGSVQQSGENEESSKKKGSDESEEDEEKTGLGSGESRNFGNTLSEENEDEKPSTSGFKQNYESDVIMGEIAGMRKKKHSFIDQSLMQKGVGNWEKHTKGIGAKLLLQMGYEPGKGLGKQLQGINAPIEPKSRKGRGAIGAYGPEVSAKIAEIIPEDKGKKRVTEKLSRWRKDDATDSKRVKYIYKSIDEVIKQGKDEISCKGESALSNVKVIDMTGPQQRVLSSYYAISTQQRPSDEWETKESKFSNFALPELVYNLNLLVKKSEQDIIQNNKKYKLGSDKIVALENEKANLDEICEADAQQSDKLKRLISIFEEMTNCSENKKLTLSHAASCFKRLQDEFREEYKLYEMSELAIKIITPLIEEELKTWQPLTNPSGPMKAMKEWKSILEQDHTSAISSATNQDLFGKLFWHPWMSSVRSAITTWDCEIPEPLVKLIEIWMPLLPEWITDDVLEQLVLPRIESHLHEWNPMTDEIPIHNWIHPWLLLLGSRFNSVVYPMIRQKLSIALAAWHPSDGSAKEMLQPWHNVFYKKDMDSFLIRNILPKLAQALDEFIINPQDQNLDEHWRWVMEWEELMPVHSMAGILEKHFFPKWHQVWSDWLNNTPNYDQVASWYTEWKGRFSDQLLKQTNIKEQFRKALELMNRSVGAGEIPEAMESVPYLKNVESDNPTHTASSRFQSSSEAGPSGTQAAISGYKELFAKRCEDKDIIFVPITSKFYEGKQVYKCGSVQVYIDRNVIFVSQNGGITWSPQSMAAVFDMAEK